MDASCLLGFLLSIIFLLQPFLTSSQYCQICPTFLKSTYTANVPENATIDTVVLTVYAFNGLGNQMSYGITYLGSNLPFEVHAVTGEIRVISQLDYLLQDIYEFTVQANVGGFQASASVIISVLDSPSPVQPVECYPAYPEFKIVQFSENKMTENSTQWINCTVSNKPSQKILYHFSDPSPPISIKDGFIQVTESLDYENQSSYSLTVSFTDTAKNPLEGNCTIKLLVLPVNEYAPAFDNVSALVYQISELAKLGTFVGQPVATDRDSGIDGNVMYGIIGGNGSDAFVINAITGELYNGIDLDREEQSVYDIVVVAYDTPANSTDSLSNSVTVVISVIDENDNAPIFDEAIHFIAVPENQAVLSAVSTLHCTDSDTGVNSAVTYHLNGQNDHFTVDSISGVLTIASQLDYESSPTHELLVQCVDSGDSRLTGGVLIIVDVININEYDPKFDEDEVALFIVVEDAVPGTILGIANATDGDDGLAGELVYELIYSTDCPNVLAINEVTGELYLTGAIDYDHPVKRSIKCLVSVHDQQKPVRTANTTVSIMITNINDNPPSCTPSVIVIAVPEDEPNGAVVVFLTCSDLDNDALIYNIIEQSSDQFAISNKSLVLNSDLDYEQNKSLVVVVSASDGYFSSQVTFFVLVAPINEHPPTFVNEVINCTVSEARAVGYCACTVSAFDKDSGIDGIISYSLDNSSTFIINSLTGDILLKATLDYETFSNYELTVYAQDSSATNARLTSSAIVSINVEDYNDHTPSMAPVTFISLSENSVDNKLVTSLNCTDLDTVSQNLLIILLSASEVYRNNSACDIDNPPFYIEGNALYTNGSIDYEATKFYQLTLSCSDGGEPLLSTSSIIAVYVDEENEFMPHFTSPSTKLMLDYSLNVEVGEVLYIFQASDDDSGLSGDISYSLSFDSLEYIPFLAIQETSGQLIMLTPLTCAYGDVLEYAVVATDGGQPPQSTDERVIISIIDCELAQPTADSTIYTTTLAETAMQGTVVAQVVCTSPTPHLLPDTATIHYTIVNNVTLWFDIDTLTGEILVSGALDYETEPVIILHIQCYYSHDSLYNKQLTAYVNLLPQNEHTPTFSQPHYSLTLSEDTTPGCIISTVLATDSDYGRDGDIRYSLSGNGPFMLHPQTAELHLINYLDREVERLYCLTITARDNPVNASHTRTSSITVNVSISDINDNRPHCTPLVYYSTIKPTIAVGTLLHTLNCTDPDKGENGTLHYSIDSTGTTSWPVQVDAVSGSVYVSKALAEDSPLSYTVPINVRDRGSEGLSAVVYMVVVVDVTTKDVVVFDPSFLSVAENEGWSNNVTVSIKDMWSFLWTTEIEEIFKAAIVNSTSSYCALQPVQCSLLGACENVTNSDASWDKNGCLSYDVFNTSNVIVHPTLTETTVGDMTILKLYIYVQLPNGAIKSPFRETEYVIPKDTLGIIVKNNNDLIGAIVRDTVNDFLMILNTGWKQASIALIVILTILLFIGTITFAIIQTHKWYLWKRDRTVIFNSNKLQPSLDHKERQQEEVQTTSFTRCSYSMTPPSMISTRPTPDGQSLVNLSASSSSGRSSANHHWCHTHSLLHKLESVASQSDSAGCSDYNHPHAVEHTNT